MISGFHSITLILFWVTEPCRSGLNCQNFGEPYGLDQGRGHRVVILPWRCRLERFSKLWQHR